MNVSITISERKKTSGRAKKRPLVFFFTFTNTVIQDPEESLTEEPELDGIEDWFVRQEAKVNICYMEK